MENIGYIYGLKCPIRGEVVYIGQTHNKLNIRLTKHISLTKTKIKYNRTLNKKEHWIKKLIKLNREKEIEIILIEECALNIIDDREIFYIQKYSQESDYMKNLSIGGRVNRGHTHTEESKKRMSEGRKGKNIGSDNHFYNKEWTDEELENLSNKLKIYYDNNDSIWLGKTHSSESIEKIKKSRKGKYSGTDHHNYGKEVGNEPWFKLADLMKSDKNPNINRKCKEETRMKISLANSGENNGMYGKRFKMTEDQIERLSTSLKNSIKLKESRNSKEYKEKISNHFSVPILVLDMEFKIVGEFKNCRVCAEYFGFKKSNIANAVRFYRKIGKGRVDKFWVVKKENHEGSIIKIKELLTYKIKLN